jgi:hypothetical protein
LTGQTAIRQYTANASRPRITSARSTIPAGLTALMPTPVPVTGSGWLSPGEVILSPEEIWRYAVPARGSRKRRRGRKSG